MIFIPETVTVLSTIAGYSQGVSELYSCGELTSRARTMLRLSYVTPTEYDNTPKVGYVIAASNRTGITLKSPNGFGCSISHNNYEYILKNSNILGTMIDQPCVWVKGFSRRSASELSLVPVSSSAFMVATDNSKALAAAPDISTIKIGDTVKTQSGIEGVYLGVHILVTSSMYPQHKVSQGTAVLAPEQLHRRHCFKTNDGIHYTTKYKPLSCTPGTRKDLDLSSATILLRNEMASGALFYSTASSISSLQFLSTPVRGVFTGTRRAITQRLIEVDPADVPDLLKQAFADRDPGVLLLERNGQKYMIEISHRHGYPTIASQYGHPFNVIPVEINSMSDTVIHVRGKSNGYFRTSITGSDISDFDKFYKIEKTYFKTAYV